MRLLKFILILLLVGCASSKNIKSATPPSSKIYVGMPSSDLVKAWGEPLSITQNLPLGKGCAKKHSVYFFRTSGSKETVPVSEEMTGVLLCDGKVATWSSHDDKTSWSEKILVHGGICCPDIGK